MPMESLESLTQFGVAGLMGVLWTWERWFSRRRETELTEAHRRLMAQREELEALVLLVRQNTEAIERFGLAQQRVGELLEKLREEAQDRRAA
ncbi:MAG: hypothetical protein ACIAXF_09880 [Phycisphaerales bacterium JB063]